MTKDEAFTACMASGCGMVRPVGWKGTGFGLIVSIREDGVEEIPSEEGSEEFVERVKYCLKVFLAEIGEVITTQTVVDTVEWEFHDKGSYNVKTILRPDKTG